MDQEQRRNLGVLQQEEDTARALLVNPQAWQVETWLDEEAVRRIAVGNQGRFRADGLEGPAIALQELAIDRDATRQLPGAELSLAQGGSIATRDQQGQHIPEHAIYRDSGCRLLAPPQIRRRPWGVQ